MRRRTGRSSRRCERTGKIRYRDEPSARHVVNRAKKNDGKAKPIRWYFCQYCKGWHLTSQERKGT